MKRPIDPDSAYAGELELARLLKKMIRAHQRSHLPRYKDRARVKNRISLQVRDEHVLKITISLDIIERWRALTLRNMDMPPPPLRPDQIDDMRLEIIHFRRKATPMMIFRLVDWAPHKVGTKLTKYKKGWIFHTHIDPRKHGIDPSGGSIKELELIPWPAVRGHVWIVPDSHRSYRQRRDDISQFLSEIDVREPPRFRHGVRDAAYLAMIAAEAAERTDQ